MADPLPFGVGSPAEPTVDQAGTVNALAGAIWNLPKHFIDASRDAVPGLRREDYTDNPNAPQPNQPMYDAAGEMALGLMGGSGWAPAEVNSLRMGIKAFHGSPHDFDRFDMSKLGSGEGAQAYGHGLYFAENPKTAEEYARRLGGRKPTINGEAFDTDNPIHRLADYSQHGNLSDRKNLSKSINDDLASMLTNNYPGDHRQIKFFQAMADHLNSGKEIPKFDPTGHRYEVDIHADPNRLLNWDKPREAQSAEVVKALRDINPAEYSISGTMFPPSMTGRQMYDQMSDAGWHRARGGNVPSTGSLYNPANASKVLNEAGIPGIKYLDRNSRTNSANPTHNYVAFNDKIIEILKKYGIAGVPAAGAAAGVAQEQEKQ